MKAIDKLTRLGIHIRCTIIGEGELRKDLENYINVRGIKDNVQILPYLPQEKIQEHVKESHIFVLPCIRAKNGDIDGLPNSILESMVIGVPVISTGISAIPEAIINRETGLIVKEKDPEALSNAILELKNDPTLYNYIATNAQKVILKEFSIEKSNEKLSKIFKSKI